MIARKLLGFLRSASRRMLSSISDNILIDKYGRQHTYLRLSLTEKCNLRCVYCMPEEGVKLSPRSGLLTLNEFKRLITIFSQHGIHKIKFTGGEPTVSNMLIELVAFAKSNRSIKKIGITSNGIMLSSQLNRLQEVGLTHVNISLDTLVPGRFEQITRRDGKGLYKVLSSVYDCISKGLPVKVCCMI